MKHTSDCLYRCLSRKSLNHDKSKMHLFCTSDTSKRPVQPNSATLLIFGYERKIVSKTIRANFWSAFYIVRFTSTDTVFRPKGLISVAQNCGHQSVHFTELVQLPGERVNYFRPSDIVRLNLSSKINTPLHQLTKVK